MLTANHTTSSEQATTAEAHPTVGGNSLQLKPRWLLLSPIQTQDNGLFKFEEDSDATASNPDVASQDKQSTVYNRGLPPTTIPYSNIQTLLPDLSFPHVGFQTRVQ